jgi:hypothetical protein
MHSRGWPRCCSPRDLSGSRNPSSGADGTVSGTHRRAHGKRASKSAAMEAGMAGDTLVNTDAADADLTENLEGEFPVDSFIDCEAADTVEPIRRLKAIARKRGLAAGAGVTSLSRGRNSPARLHTAEGDTVTTADCVAPGGINLPFHGLRRRLSERGARPRTSARRRPAHRAWHGPWVPRIGRPPGCRRS